MGTLNYQRRVRTTSASDDNWLPQIVLPMGMFLVGLAIYAWYAFSSFGGRGAMILMGVVIVWIAVNVVLGILAAYLMVMLTGASFGEVRTAIFKLAGIITLSSALATVIPMGGLLVLVIYLGLLVWQFEIEMGEAVLFAIVLTVARFLATYPVIMLLMAMTGA